MISLHFSQGRALVGTRSTEEIGKKSITATVTLPRVHVKKPVVEQQVQPSVLMKTRYRKMKATLMSQQVRLFRLSPLPLNPKKVKEPHHH